MAFGKKMVLAGVIAVGLTATCYRTRSVAAAQQGSSAQNSIPDAPRPQSLPALNSITPVKPAYTGQASSSNTTNQGTDIPATPKPTAAAATQAKEDEDQGPPPQIGPEAFRLHATVNVVEVPFTVKDSRGQLMPGLTNRDVKIYENGLLQHIDFWSADPLPLSVALVIDQSVTTDTMAKINNSIGALKSAFSPYDEVAVFTYNNGVRRQTTFTAAQSARLAAVLESSKSVGRETSLYMGSGLDQPMVKNNQPVDPNINRGSAGTLTMTPEKEYHTLNDAILEAAKETAHVGQGRRRIVYVISDGKEYGSKASQKEVIRFLQTNEVSVYATLVGDSSIPGMGFLDRIHLPYTMRDDVLPRYTAATGGQVDAEFRQHGIEQSFAKITEQVRSQYTVGYTSHEPILDERFRPLEVKVMRNNVTIIAPPGYFPRPRNTPPPTPVPTAVH